MAKPFLTFEAQIAYLENNKNLLIPDNNYASDMLKRVASA